MESFFLLYNNLSLSLSCSLFLQYGIDYDGGGGGGGDGNKVASWNPPKMPKVRPSRTGKGDKGVNQSIRAPVISSDRQLMNPPRRGG
jgi:hypothetical protein